MEAIGDPGALIAPCSTDERKDASAIQLVPGLREYAVRILEAVQLVELGGRAGLITHITGLEKKAVNRLYRQVRGVSSPPGQAPFTDAWYLEDDLRMLHASIVWRLYQQLTHSGRNHASTLIAVYKCYRSLVRETVLDMTHAAFVPSLIAMNVWEERTCEFCSIAYVAPIVSNDDECAGCQLYHRHRCRTCGDPIPAHRRGRRRRTCDQCR